MRDERELADLESVQDRDQGAKGADESVSDA
jgi:hypothetical protein